MIKNFTDPLQRFDGISKEELQQRLKKLSEKELEYFKLMLPKSGVLYIQSEPGIAKSAIIKSIADKIGFKFFDLRLSMVDETDVGLYPTLVEKDIESRDGEQTTQKFLDHVPPLWAYEANQQPSIVFFEELNRSTLQVRNAGLQILLERTIGTKFKFTDNVLMVASGNLGEADGTDVEEFDSALNNRLIHRRHQLTNKEWFEGFANENIHPTIIAFLESSAEHFYKKVDQEDSGIYAYATPRSWTFLSDYINTNYPPTQTTNSNGEPLYVDEDHNIVDKDHPRARPKWNFASMSEWLSDVERVASYFVGQSATRFIRYCNESLRIGINDILDRYDEIKDDLAKNFKRDKHSELLTSLRKYKLEDLTKKQMENVKNFLVTISDDEITNYLLHVLDNEFDINDDMADKKDSKVLSFIRDKRFKKFYKTVLDHCERDEPE